MAVNALTIAHTLTEEELAGRVQAYVDRNVVPWVAAERVVDDIRREGRQDELLALAGPGLLFSVWENNGRRRFSDAARDKMAAGRTEASGRRRVNADVLKRDGALMESLFEVNGSWIKIGDMDRVACHRAARVQKLVAVQRAHYARFFHALANDLTDGRTVRQALSEAELTRIFDEATPTLGGGR